MNALKILEALKKLREVEPQWEANTPPVDSETIDERERAGLIAHLARLNQMARPSKNRGLNIVAFRPSQVHFKLSLLKFLPLAQTLNWKVFVALRPSDLERVDQAYRGIAQLHFQEMNEEEFAFLFQHPSVNLVVDLDAQLFEDNFAEPYVHKLGAYLLTKQWSVYTGGKSVAVVLKGADLADAADQIIAGAHYKEGKSPWSLHRVLVQEGLEEEFRDLVLQKVKALSGNEDHGLKTDFQMMHRELTVDGEARMLNSSQARVVVFENVPHCTVWQNRMVSFPHLFLQSIKYPFEAAKWLNANPQLHNVAVFGPGEKIGKMQETIICQSLSHNEVAPQLDWDGPLASWFGYDFVSLTERFIR